MLKFNTCYTYIKINWPKHTCTEFLFQFELMNHFIYSTPPFLHQHFLYIEHARVHNLFYFFALKYQFYWIFFIFFYSLFFCMCLFEIKHFINFITKVFSLTYLRDGKIRCDVLNIAYWKERKHSKNKIINKRNKENTRKKNIYKLAWHACMIQWCSYK